MMTLKLFSWRFLKNLFKPTLNGYDLRNKRCWDTPGVKTDSYGLETIRYRGPIIWGMVPNSIKESENLEIFKKCIKNWKATQCKCRLCKIYIPNLGYL